jgi:hypothetical protein
MYFSLFWQENKKFLTTAYLLEFQNNTRTLPEQMRIPSMAKMPTTPTVCKN